MDVHVCHFLFVLRDACTGLYEWLVLGWKSISSSSSSVNCTNHKFKANDVLPSPTHIHKIRYFLLLASRPSFTGIVSVLRPLGPTLQGSQNKEIVHVLCDKYNTASKESTLHWKWQQMKRVGPTRHLLANTSKLRKSQRVRTQQQLKPS